MVTIRNNTVAKIIYGALFLVLLPLILFIWASALDRIIDLPVPNPGTAAIVCIVVGFLLVAKGMLDLWVLGKGLPMNAFPPKRFVSTGLYAWFSHPIYLGVALLAAGFSLRSGSGSGLYIITPVLVLGMISLVYGYERAAIQREFGDAVGRAHPIFSIPNSGKLRRPVITGVIFLILMIYLSVVFFLFDLRLADNSFIFGVAGLLTLFLAISYQLIWNIFKSFGEWVANSPKLLKIFQIS
jgi:protein-S-isoprenylcysteine O-methyltransferase Ste14